LTTEPDHRASLAALQENVLNDLFRDRSAEKEIESNPLQHRLVFPHHRFEFAIIDGHLSLVTWRVRLVLQMFGAQELLFQLAPDWY
jgi:hypothetical protein